MSRDLDGELNRLLDEDYLRRRQRAGGEAWAPYKSMRVWRRLFFCSVAVNFGLWLWLLFLLAKQHC
jgi:hypothetical protein